MNKLRSIFLIFFLFFIATSSQALEWDFSVIREIPILDQGRIKPFDTFARESVQMITGKKSFEKQDPVQTLLDWFSFPDKAIQTPLLDARYEPLAKRLKLEPVHGRVSPAALTNNSLFKEEIEQVMMKEQAGDKLTESDKQLQSLFSRANLFHQILTGESLKIIPLPHSSEWMSLEASQDPEKMQIVKELISAYQQKEASRFLQASLSLKTALGKDAQTNTFYTSQSQIDREIRFNQLHPFQKAWILFCASFILVLLCFVFSARWLYLLAWITALLGIGIASYGFVLRCLIAGRPPVSNMYESVIWVSVAAMVFALIFEAIYRSRFFLLSGAIGATIGLVLADNLPNVLSPNINPLVPVLRSNFWLTIHVLTITLSYAAFLVATGVGEIALGFYAFKPQAQEKLKSLNLFVYRAVQLGVVLVAAGTILGGVWANYSWGRFWGWDPKEVWALIVLLGYIVILHGRYAGWLKNFGMIVWTVLAFLLVLMAWYGVNFVLGVGLHSYGFSSGGFKQVMLFVLVQLAWVGFATYRYRTSKARAET